MAVIKVDLIKEFPESSRALTLHEGHDGMTWVMFLQARSRRELSRLVKARNWRKDTGCGRDCTGELFAASCELLRAFHRNDGVWVGVVVCSEARDV